MTTPDVLAYRRIRLTETIIDLCIAAKDPDRAMAVHEVLLCDSAAFCRTIPTTKYGRRIRFQEAINSLVAGEHDQLAALVAAANKGMPQVIDAAWLNRIRALAKLVEVDDHARECLDAIVAGASQLRVISARVASQ